jgi:hypothetical protein
MLQANSADGYHDVVVLSHVQPTNRGLSLIARFHFHKPGTIVMPRRRIGCYDYEQNSPELAELCLQFSFGSRSWQIANV